MSIKIAAIAFMGLASTAYGDNLASWKLLYRQTTTSGKVPTVAQWAAGVNKGDPTSDNYSILDELKGSGAQFLGDDGKFQFKLIHGDSHHNNVQTQVWRQTSNPMLGAVNGGATGYEEVHVATRKSLWGGLEKSQYCVLDGSVNHLNYFYGVGCGSTHVLHGSDRKVKFAELYVLDTATCSSILKREPCVKTTACDWVRRGKHSVCERKSGGPAFSRDADYSKFPVPIGTAPQLGFTGSAFTASAWIYRTFDDAEDFSIFGTDETAPDGRSPNTRFSKNTGLHLIVRNRNFYMGFFSNDCGSNTPSKLNTWQHVAYVYSSGTMKIYVDGEEAKTCTGKEQFTGTGTVNIGQWANGSKFEGHIRDPIIWTRALDKGEIKQMVGDIDSLPPPSTAPRYSSTPDMYCTHGPSGAPAQYYFTEKTRLECKNICDGRNDCRMYLWRTAGGTCHLRSDDAICKPHATAGYTLYRRIAKKGVCEAFNEGDKRLTCTLTGDDWEIVRNAPSESECLERCAVLAADKPLCCAWTSRGCSMKVGAELEFIWDYYNSYPVSKAAKCEPVTRTECAGEHQKCKCSGTVYYGRKYEEGSKTTQTDFNSMIGYAYKKKSANGEIACTSAAMGGDPVHGQLKKCFCEAYEKDEYWWNAGWRILKSGTSGALCYTSPTSAKHEGALFKGWSAGLADCKSKCTSNAQCKFFSYWNTKWCQTDSVCNHWGSDGNHMITTYGLSQDRRRVEIDSVELAAAAPPSNDDQMIAPSNVSA